MTGVFSPEEKVRLLEQLLEQLKQDIAVEREMLKRADTVESRYFSKGYVTACEITLSRIRAILER